jgi:hypothetical protein
MRLSKGILFPLVPIVVMLFEELRVLPVYE